MFLYVIRLVLNFSIILVLIYSCTPRISRHGNFFTQNELKVLQFTQLNKSEIIEILGQPSTRSTFSDFFGYFFSRKVYFSQIWWAIFLETIFLHFINMHMEKGSKFQTFSAHSISTTIWPPGCTTCISWKFSHHVTPPAIVGKLATRWRHMHLLKIWPPGRATCISWKFGD